MIEIAFEGVPNNEDIEGLLSESLRVLFEHLKLAPDSSLSMLITTDEILQQLNREHRGEDKATDVLSFASDGEQFEAQTPYLGDIAISIERAEAQAGQGGHTREAELQLLCVHGALHLLGYDHADAQGRREMWNIQNELLDRLGVELDREKIGS